MNYSLKLQHQIKAASDAFVTMQDTHFAAWSLTVEESAVARLGLQGYGVHDCADILHIRPEAAELHQNSAFAKIGVSSWSDLMRHLTEQLLNGAKRQTPCPFVWT